MDLEFIRPSWLLALVLLLPLAGILFYFERTRIRRLLILGVSEFRQLRPIHILHAAIMVLLIVAVARPFWGYDEIEVHTKGTDTMLVIDISLSMLTKDLPPSRLKFATFKLLDVLQHLKTNLPGDRLGIVLFSGESYLYCPLTSDYGALKLFIDSISPDLISTPGSVLNGAVDTALTAFGNSLAYNPKILLITDGEDDVLDASRAIEAANSAKIPINVLAVGSLQGMPIEIESGQFVKTRRGEIVISKLKEENLQKISRETAGMYIRAGVGEHDLNLLFPRRTVESVNLSGVGAELISGPADAPRIRIYNELGPLLLLIPLGGILIALVLRKRELVFFLLALVVLPHPARSESASLYQAYGLYNEGRYQEALKIFEQEYRKNPDDLKTLQSLASSHYKTGNFKEAQSLFQELERKAETPREEFAAKYDLGNAHFNLKDFKSAVEDYKEALKIKENDQAALHNLRLAEAELQRMKAEQQKKEEQEQSKGEEKEDQQNQDKDKDKEQDQDQKSAQGEEQQDQGSGSQEKQGADGDKNESQQEEQRPTPQADKPQGEEDKESKEQQNNEGQTHKQVDRRSLAEKEADAWLDSLPEAPALLQSRKRRAVSGTHQAW